MKSQNELQELESILTFLGIEFIDKNGHRLTNGHKTAKTIGEIKAFFRKEVMTSGQFLKDIDWWDFKNDWNDLFFLVERIEGLKYFKKEIQFSITKYAVSIQMLTNNNGVVIGDVFSKWGTYGGTEKMKAVYNACLEFIKWHNEQKEK